MRITTGVSVAAIAFTLVATSASARPRNQVQTQPTQTTQTVQTIQSTQTVQNTQSIQIQAVATSVTPALSPAPAGPVNSSLDPVTVSQTFPAYQATQKWEVPSAGGAQFFGNYARITGSVRYDAATQSYILTDTGDSTKHSTFGPANKVVPDSDPRFTYYSKSGGGTSETLRLLKPGASNPFVQLTYTGYGEWRATTPGAGYQGATAVSDTYFVYGVRTASADVPRTGGADYNTVIDGTFVNSRGTYALSGSALFHADWGLARINITATPVGTPVTATGSPIAFGAVGASGSINFNSASFSANPVVASNPNYQLMAAGYFFGPAAAEVGAVFRLSGMRGSGSGNGVMVGKR